MNSAKQSHQAAKVVNVTHAFVSSLNNVLVSQCSSLSKSLKDNSPSITFLLKEHFLSHTFNSLRNNIQTRLTSILLHEANRSVQTIGGNLHLPNAFDLVRWQTTSLVLRPCRNISYIDVIIEVQRN